MDNANNIATLPKTQVESDDDAGSPIHEQFSWLHADLRGNTEAEFCALVKDVTAGCKTILALVHADTLERDAGERPVLSIQQTEYLMLMAMRSVEMIGESSEARIDHMNRQAFAKQTKSAAVARNREASPA